VDFPDPVCFAGIILDALGYRGLAGINVRRNPYIPDFPEPQGFFFHNRKDIELLTSKSQYL